MKETAGRMLVVAICAGLAGPTMAQGVALRITDFQGAQSGPAFNHVILEITNTCKEAELVAFTLEVFGRAHFDGPVPLSDPRSKVSKPKGTSMTLVRPDYDHGGGARSKVFELTFNGFRPGETVVIDTDIDVVRTGSGSVEDARVLFWNNGDVPNAEVVATFLDGGIARATLPDAPSRAGYVFEIEKDWGLVGLDAATD